MNIKCLYLTLFSYLGIIVSGQTVYATENTRLSNALNPKVAPGGNFDLSIWSLQLPTGEGTSPTTIHPAQLVGAYGYTDSNYFYSDKADGAMTLMDPQQGITTSGSSHCRTELREMTPDGAAAAWEGSGTNTMIITGAIAQVGGGSGGHVALGQVFNSTDGIPLCELEYYTAVNGFKVLYEEAKGAGIYFDLNTPCAVNTKYTFSLSISNNALVIFLNGKQVFSKTPGFSSKQFYFKCGCYDQTAIAGAPLITPYTTVKIYSISVRHDLVASSLSVSYKQSLCTREIVTRGVMHLSGATTLLDGKSPITGIAANGQKWALRNQGFYVRQIPPRD